MPRRLLAYAALAVSAVSAAALVAISPAAQAADPLDYVALGDSYSAASGVLPPDPAAPCCACAPAGTTRTCSRRRRARG